MDKISITEKELEKLKELYSEAKKQGKESFMFKGREVLTNYAKYMIEYLDLEFGKQK